MTLADHAQAWDDLAREDPLWAILSAPGTEHGKWDIDAFFATGAAEMDLVMAVVDRLKRPLTRARALDFGCGVGRVTRAMAAHFDECVGVDISDAMLESARRLNGDIATCRFVANARADLTIFDDDDFDFVYSRIVLQHLPDEATIRSYIREFVRVLRPGGLLVFQLPVRIPLRYRVQPRRRIYGALRRVGVPPNVLRHRLDLHPIRMNGLAEGVVRELLARSEATLLDVERSIIEGYGIPSNTYLVTKSTA